MKKDILLVMKKKIGDFQKLLWNRIQWRYMKHRLEYTDEEMAIFRNNPRNEVLLARVPHLMSKKIIAEVIESHGCNSKHKVGDQFVFDGFGNLLTQHCPRKICLYALNAIVPQIFAVTELLRADADPNKMRFNRASCFDVGVECGGFGRIAMEVKVVNK